MIEAANLYYYNSMLKLKEYYKDSMHVVTIFNTRSN